MTVVLTFENIYQLEEEGTDAMESLEKTLRVRKVESENAKAAAGVDDEVCMYICMYVYVYIHVHIYMCKYI